MVCRAHKRPAGDGKDTCFSSLLCFSPFWGGSILRGLFSRVLGLQLGACTEAPALLLLNVITQAVAMGLTSRVAPAVEGWDPGHWKQCHLPCTSRELTFLTAACSYWEVISVSHKPVSSLKLPWQPRPHWEYVTGCVWRRCPVRRFGQPLTHQPLGLFGNSNAFGKGGGFCVPE